MEEKKNMKNVKAVFLINILSACNYYDMDHRLEEKESKRDTLSNQNI